MVGHIKFEAGRKVDEDLFKKLEAVHSKPPYSYDDATGLARKLLHEQLDAVMQKLDITIDSDSVQPAVG